MNEKQGLIQQELDKIFASNNLTAHDLGKTNALLQADQQQKIYQLIDDANTDFPYKIYKDNNGFGENPKPVFSFYIKNPVDPDKSFPVEDLEDVEREIALWHKKWFGKPNL